MSKIKNISIEAVKVSVYGALIIALLRLFGIPVPEQIIKAVEIVKTVPAVIQSAQTEIDRVDKEIENLE